MDMANKVDRVELEKMRLDSGKEWKEVAKEVGMTKYYLSRLINGGTGQEAVDKWLPKIKNALKQ